MKELNHYIQRMQEAENKVQELETIVHAQHLADYQTSDREIIHIFSMHVFLKKVTGD